MMAERPIGKRGKNIPFAELCAVLCAWTLTSRLPLPARNAMSSAGGLSRRRVQPTAASDAPSPPIQSSFLEPSTPSGLPSPGSSNDLNGLGLGHGHAGTAMEGGNKIAYDPRDLGNDDSVEGGKVPKLTILEEVLLLGLKDKQVSVPQRICSCLRLALCTAYISSTFAQHLMARTAPCGFDIKIPDAAKHNANFPSLRVTCLSGTITSRMPSAAASSLSLPSDVESP